MPRKNTLSVDYPQAVLKQIEQLAQNIVIARKRRGESQAQWAKKLGISQPTMVRIERGDPSVAMASYVMCMWLINQAGGLAELVAPQNDHAALEREVAKVRIKRKSKTQERGADPDVSQPLAAAQMASKNKTKSLEPVQRTINAAAKLNESLEKTGNLSELLGQQAKLKEFLGATNNVCEWLEQKAKLKEFLGATNNVSKWFEQQAGTAIERNKILERTKNPSDLPPLSADRLVLLDKIVPKKK